MSQPCEECIKGSIHKGQPQGKEELIHGLNTYVVGNRANPKAIVVMYSDIFSLLLPNNKLIADAYAKETDYLVYFPDFFKGDAVPLKVADVLIPVDTASQSTIGKYGSLLASAPSFLMWMTRHKEGPTNKICMDFMAALRRATPTNLKIGMVGFCWGGKYAVRAGLESEMIDVNGVKTPLINAAVAFHPSHLSVPADVEDLVVPVSFGWGVEDIAVDYKLKGKIQQVHEKASQGGRKVPEMEHKDFKPGRHGFAVRGNPDDPAERACLEDSMTQGLKWFARWLS